MRILLFPLLAVAAWMLSRRMGESAPKVVYALPIVAAVAFLVNVSTGLVRGQPTVSSAHQWSAHALLIAVWLFVPFSAGVGLQQNIGRRPGLAIVQSGVLLSLLALVVLASFTGYLGPSHVAEIAEETSNRFEVLHLFALPCLIAILLTTWYWLFRP